MNKPANRPAFAEALGHDTTDKRIEILRLTQRSGSISQAARDAGVSYKAAWQAIDTLTNLAGVALVERAVGGAGGGGAVLTEAGLQLVDAAEQVERARHAVLARLATGPGDASVLHRLAVRTSMRNQLPATVRSCKTTGRIVLVTMALADGTPLVSRITRESAELLGLAAGLTVQALCKATAVPVMASMPAGDGAAGVNVLAGDAVRVARAKSGDEVSLTLAGGLQLVGFAPPGSGIRLRQRVWAQIDASAVVIALA